jgi:hypothetical protein
MSTVAGTLQILSAASIGVYAGAMLTEGFVLVPYWRSASAPGLLRTCHLGRRALCDRRGRRDVMDRAARAMGCAPGRGADGRGRIQLLHLFRACEHELLQSRRQRSRSPCRADPMGELALGAHRCQPRSSRRRSPVVCTRRIGGRSRLDPLWPATTARGSELPRWRRHPFQQMVDEGLDDGREMSAARIDYVDRR